MGLFSKIANVGVGLLTGGIKGGVQALAGQLSQDSTNQANMDLAKLSNDTAINLADTAYQRRVKDLTAAGLNPMLAYTQGGAQVPTLTTARVENSGRSATEQTLSSTQTELLRSQIATQESQADLNSAQAASIRAETPNKPLLGEQIKATTDHIKEQIYSLGLTNALTRSQRELVDAEINNAAETGRKIRAETGNIAVDTVLKKAQTIQTDINSSIEQSKFDYEVPRLKAESAFHSSKYGKEMAPYVSSAKGLGLFDIPKAEVMKRYHSR